MANIKPQDWVQILDEQTALCAPGISEHASSDRASQRTQETP